MKYFIGVFPPKELLPQFRAYRQYLKRQKQNLTFVPAPEIYLSIKFLGYDLDESSIEQISAMARNLIKEMDPFEIEFDRVQLGFDNDTRPSTLLIKVKNTTALDRAAREIQSSINRKVFPEIALPQKRFEPHLTIGKMHGNIHSKKMQEIREGIKQNPISISDIKFLVDKISLISCETIKDNNIYKEVRSFGLRKS